MPTRPHLASLLSIFLSLVTANAQDEARRRLDELRAKLVDEVKLQLRSGDPKTIAWGAHAAAEHRLFACRDDLRAALRTFAKDDPDQSRYAANTVLDALVQTVATVPMDELEPFFTEDPAIVLLLRDEPGTDVLLRALRVQAEGFGPWRACGNVLAARQSSDLVLDVLRARVMPWVRVCDREPIELLPPDSVGCSMDFEHDGWPPFPRYRLEFAPDTGRRVLSGGPFPSFYTRDLHGSAGRCTQSSECTISEARPSWLLHLLGNEHEQAVRAIDRDRTLKWRDAASYPADVRALRAGIEADWRRVVTACVDKKLIPADAAKGLAPQIVLGEWNLRDWRDDTSIPLPRVR